MANLTTMPTDGMTLFEQQLHYHLALAYDLFGNEKHKESSDSGLVPRVTAKQGKSAEDKETIIYRVALEMHPDWRTSTNRIRQS